MDREYYLIFDRLYRKFADFDPDLPMAPGLVVERVRGEIEEAVELCRKADQR